MNWLITIGLGLLAYPQLPSDYIRNTEISTEIPQFDNVGVITGYVKSFDDNSPICEAHIEVLNTNYQVIQTRKTDKNGFYRFDRLEVNQKYYVKIDTEAEVEGTIFREVEITEDRLMRQIGFVIYATWGLVDTVITFDPETFEELVEVRGGLNIQKAGTHHGIENIVLSAPPITNQTEGMSLVSENPFSTFSIDVDKASYSLFKAHLEKGYPFENENLRIEEMVNYFHYSYPNPEGEIPFATHTTFTDCPWNSNAELLHIGVQGNRMEFAQAPPSNMVFLLDVSGSMSDDLELVKTSIKLIVDQMRSEDKISIVVYAGAAGLVLPPTSGNNKTTILNALNKLSAGGSTAGGAGIQLAYKIAQDNFIEGGNNRVILATDGDFNVGTSGDQELEDLIVEKRENGVFLTALGFGYGNYQDAKMETLADKGNGVYAYIADQATADKILLEEAGAALITIAKDVKIQLEFNDEVVKAYRLIGYDNRRLETEDFEDDTKDAGELGAGHSVTAIYEVVYHDKDKLKRSDRVVDINLRYKPIDEDVSKLITTEALHHYKKLEKVNDDIRWSIAIAQWALMVRNEDYVQNTTYKQLYNLASSAIGDDQNSESEREDALILMDIWNKKYLMME